MSKLFHLFLKKTLLSRIDQRLPLILFLQGAIQSINQALKCSLKALGRTTSYLGKFQQLFEPLTPKFDVNFSIFPTLQRKKKLN
jgi:hypothetical protein